MKLLPGRAPKIDKLKRKGDFHGLIRALGYEDVVADRGGALVDLGVSVRHEAATALSDLSGPTPRKGLLRTLTDPEESVRLAGIRGLRRRPDPATTNGLLESVAFGAQPSYEASRREAIDALEQLADATLPERLAAALMERPTELAEGDADALRHLATADPSGRGGARVVEYLIEGLGAPDDVVEDRAARMLVWLAPDSTEALMEALTDQDPRRQRRAAAALGTIRDSRASEALIELLGSHDAAAREAAAWALGELKDPSAVEALLRATGDSTYSVRSAAGAGLDKLGTVAVIVGVTAVVGRVLPNGAGADSSGAIEARLERAQSPSEDPDSTQGSRSVGLLRRLLERDSFP